MVRRAWLFGLILVVPAIGFAVAEGIQAHFNSQLRSEARQQVPDADAEGIAELTVDRLCETPSQDTAELCATNTHLNLMSSGSVAAGLAGLGLIGLIALAGFAARRNRMLLLLLFKPGLYFTAVLLTGLIFIHAVIAIAAIYFGESALVNRIHLGIIAAVGLGALSGVVAIGRSAFSLVKKAETIAIGRAVARQDAPDLWKAVEDTARRLGALHPEHIVVGLDPNFFVTEADVVTLGGKLTGRTLYCSLSLARILTNDEFISVIGHELGHFKGLDTKFSERFYPIYRGTATSIASLQAAGGEGWGALALLPAIAVLSYFLEAFAVAEARLGRERELAADQAGASVTDARVMAAALVKVHAYSEIWDALQGAAAQALKEGRMFVNLAQTYAEAVAPNATPAAFDDIDTKQLSHPTDSHPPLSVRLESLGTTLGAVADTALVVAPTVSAVAFIQNSEHWERDISEAYQVLLARQAGIDLEAAAEQTTNSPSPIRRCASCKMKVLPTGDGRCPSCGGAFGSPASLAT